MKTRLLLFAILLIGVLCFPLTAGRDKRESSLSGGVHAVPNPTADSVPDRLQPGNKGSYLEFWANTNSDSVEYRTGTGEFTWSPSLPPPHTPPRGACVEGGASAPP